MEPFKLNKVVKIICIIFGFISIGLGIASLIYFTYLAATKNSDFYFLIGSLLIPIFVGSALLFYGFYKPKKKD